MHINIIAMHPHHWRKNMHVHSTNSFTNKLSHVLQLLEQKFHFQVKGNSSLTYVLSKQAVSVILWTHLCLNWLPVASLYVKCLFRKQCNEGKQDGVFSFVQPPHVHTFNYISCFDKVKTCILPPKALAPHISITKSNQIGREIGLEQLCDSWPHTRKGALQRFHFVLYY